MFVIIFGYRSFGACDYFTLTDDSPTKYYVRTQFFHISFLPLCPVKSYIASSDDNCCGTEKVLVILPEMSCKSVGWAWLRNIFFLGAVGCALGAFFSIYNSYDQTLWKQIVLGSVSALLLAIGLLLTLYPFGASAEAQQEYREMIASRLQVRRVRRVATTTGEVVTIREPALGGLPSGMVAGGLPPSTNVQAQIQKPPEYSVDAPTYGYDQGPVQNYAVPSLPSAMLQPRPDTLDEVATRPEVV